jgi:PsbN protein
METATILIIFVSSLLLGITSYSIFTAFGPASKNLRDPFEEHEDKKNKTIYLYIWFYYRRIRGVSLKKTAKKITINVPISKNV